MGRVGQKNTSPELIAQKRLKRLRRRFTTNRRDLPGSPDIAYERQKVAIFVHGCFWHRHPGCHKATTPKIRREFWQSKFRTNQKRDLRNKINLQKLGWRVFIIWECQLTSCWKIPEQLAAAILK